MWRILVGHANGMRSSHLPGSEMCSRESPRIRSAGSRSCSHTSERLTASDQAVMGVGERKGGKGPRFDPGINQRRDSVDRRPDFHQIYPPTSNADSKYK